MNKLFKALLFGAATIVTLIALFLGGFQILQAIDDRKHHGGASGIVLDQEGNPLAGVDLTFSSWNWRAYVPIPFGPTRIVQKTIKAKTDALGRYSVAGPYPRTSFLSIFKRGYRQDGPETPSFWYPIGAAKPGPWDFHLADETQMRQEEISKLEFTSVPFPQDGQIGLDLVEKTLSNPKNPDIVFQWRHLAAAKNHGDYGTLSVFAPKGGVWFWEQDRLFAPTAGYEQGITFIFGTQFRGAHGFSYNAYPHRRRAEFYVKSRDGKVYARVYAELNTANQTLSLRARVNNSGNRFVDATGGAYQIGVYSSMSGNYLNPGDPWWIQMDSDRAQVIMPEERLRVMATNFTAYFAGHYRTPSDILEWLADSNHIQDHYIPQYLARNYATPTNVLTKLIEADPSGSRWFGEDARAVLNSPQDVKNIFRTENN